MTYPRTNSRFLPGDMVGELKPTAALVGRQREYARAAEYVTGLDVLPLGRVVNDAKVTDHHAIIPTKAEHRVDKMSDDDRRVYDMVVRRFLAVFHPDAVFENTRLETTVAEHVFRTRGRVLVVPGWRGVYGEGISDGDSADEDDGGDQQLPKLSQGEAVRTLEIEALEKVTKPPRRYSDASLLGAMETAGKLVEEDEMREAMKDSGIGTPATRAAIIERLIDVGYVEREGRALVATEKGTNVIKFLGEHALTSPSMTGDWEHRLGRIEEGEESRERFMRDIAEFARETVGELDAKLKEVRVPRANLGPCPVCGRDIVENRKGFSCWSREDPGCGFVIWKSKAGKNLPATVARELISRGRTEKAVTGFKGRSGRSFRAKLALMQAEDGKWRVEFDEPWAREGAKPPEGEEQPAGRGCRRRGGLSERQLRGVRELVSRPRGWIQRSVLPRGRCVTPGQDSLPNPGRSRSLNAAVDVRYESAYGRSAGRRAGSVPASTSTASSAGRPNSARQTSADDAEEPGARVLARAPRPRPPEPRPARSRGTRPRRDPRCRRSRPGWRPGRDRRPCVRRADVGAASLGAPGARLLTE